jgi:hypothetical protein
MAEILGPEPDALSNDEIIQKYDGSLTQCTKAATDPLYDFERTLAISAARYQWLLVKGQQNIGLGWSSNDYGTQQPDWVPFDYSAGQEETGADVRLCPPVNFIGGDCFKFMAVMGSSSPRVKAVPDDIHDPQDIANSHCADVNIRDLWIKNKIDRKWKIPSFHLYTTGPCFVRTFWNTDSVKYGESIEPKIDIQQDEFGNPMPVVTGSQAYANGDAEVSFHSVLEVSVPWEAKELRGNFLKCERMLSKWSLLAKYPGKNGQPGPLDKYRDGTVPDDEMTGASVAAAQAKQAVSNPSSTAQTIKPNEWRFTEWWIPPHLYEAMSSEEARNVTKRQFGRGLYIAKVGQITVEIDEREVTEEWTVVQVNRGEKIMERPVCADNVPLQRAINDLVGMAIETVLRAITQTIADNQLIDRQSMSTKNAVPAEIILTALPVDGDISKRIFQIPPCHLSDQVLPLMNLIRGWGQDISGIRAELSGGGQPTQTYREAKQRRDQALAQLAPQAQAMRDAAEDIAKNLVALRGKYGRGIVKSQRKGAYGAETDCADMEDIRMSGWNAQSDDQFPLTDSDKRDALYSMLHEFSPEVQQALSILDPINSEAVLSLIQIPGFTSAIEEQKQKTLETIDHLMSSQPLPGPALPNGIPGPPQPSIQPDPFDNLPLVAQLTAKWLISPVGQKNAGTPGYANVVAYWQVVNKMATPPIPAPPPPVKGSLALSAKLEDFPNLVNEVFVGAGLPAPPPTPAPPPLPPGPPRPALAAPGPVGKPPLTSPIPPLPSNGPQPPPHIGAVQ